NLTLLCGRCSADRAAEFAVYVGSRTTRDRMRTANNRRTGAELLTDSRRKALIRARGDACEVCGAPAVERVLQVHHRIPVLQGGRRQRAEPPGPVLRMPSRAPAVPHRVRGVGEPAARRLPELPDTR